MFVLASAFALGGCNSLLNQYERGSAESAEFRLLIAHSGPDLVGEIENKSTAERWTLPVQTTKTTYPVWPAARFDREHNWLLLPVEKALDRLMRDDCSVDRGGSAHCYSLLAIDLVSRQTVARKPLSKTEAVRAGIGPD